MPETQPCHCGQATQSTSGSVKGSRGECVCMRVFASVLVYVCVCFACVSACVCIYTCVHVFVCLHVYVVCIHTFMSVWVHTFVHVCLRVCVSACVLYLCTCV